MKQTGGYKGTDLDESKSSVELMQLRTQIDSFQAKRLGALKKERRHYREKILCAENCQFEKWSFLTGISLNENCPVDCPLSTLNGEMKFKSSVAALDAYNSFGEIQDIAQNKKELEKIDL
jgi:hypothetical protein|tara:strand:+ start:337 stop:696 length:360 start_codon:yes stop_codon:yes gene_type:complete